MVLNNNLTKRTDTRLHRSTYTTNDDNIIHNNNSNNGSKARTAMPATTEDDDTEEESMQFVNRYGILFQQQRSDCYLWIVVILVRRALCSLLNTTLSTSITARAFSIFIVHFMALLLHLIVQPYRHRVHNWLESYSLFTLTLIAAIVSAYPHPPYSYALQIMVGLLAAAFLFVAFVVFVVATWYVTRRTRQHQQFIMREMEAVAMTRIPSTTTATIATFKSPSIAGAAEGAGSGLARPLYYESQQAGTQQQQLSQSPPEQQQQQQRGHESSEESGVSHKRLLTFSSPSSIRSMNYPTNHHALQHQHQLTKQQRSSHTSTGTLGTTTGCVAVPAKRFKHSITTTSTQRLFAVDPLLIATSSSLFPTTATITSSSSLLASSSATMTTPATAAAAASFNNQSSTPPPTSSTAPVTALSPSTLALTTPPAELFPPINHIHHPTNDIHTEDNRNNNNNNNNHHNHSDSNANANPNSNTNERNDDSNPDELTGASSSESSMFSGNPLFEPTAASSASSQLPFIHP